MKKLVVPALIVFILALVVRLWQLPSYPAHLSIDEVAIGYNGYSILTSGKDEWGQRLPLAFESVGDYKPPVNIYLTSLTIKLFGLTEFAVRLPSAVTGALTAPAIIFLLFVLGMSPAASIFGGVWLALSAWHVHFSRGGFEAVTGLLFVILGAIFFINWVASKKLSHLVLAGVTFGLAVWSYHSLRLYAPLLFVFLAIHYKNKINLAKTTTRKQLLIFIAVVAVFALPFAYLSIFTPAIRARAQMTFMASEISFIKGHPIANVFIFARHWVGKYLNYFDLRFWFWKGMNFTPPGYPDLGLLYLIDVVLFIPGVYSLVKSKHITLKRFAFFAFLVGPLAASLTRGEQHPLRALLWVPFFIIILASGYDYLLKKPKTKWLVAGYLVGLIANFVFFVDIYTVQFPYFFAPTWQYGYKEIANYACDHKTEYDQIFISESFGVTDHFTSVPQEYLAFYCGGKPTDYLSENPRNGIFIKRPLWDNDRYTFHRTLFIAAPWDFPIEKVPQEQIIKRVTNPDGSIAFIFVRVD